MRPKACITSGTADAASFCDNSRPIDGFKLPTKSSLSGENYEDVLLPYPSPPGVPDCEPIQTTLKPSKRPTSSLFDTANSENGVVVSVSTSFNPASHSTVPDVIFNTSDMVLFYAHSHVLGCYSSEAFSRVLQSPTEKNETTHDIAGPDIIHDVPDSSSVFNIILHALYGTSPSQNSPAFDTLTAAVDRMMFYGINPKDLITKQTPLYQLLLSHAPLYPLQLYSLAGRQGLEDLAVASSSHLLGFPIPTLPDDIAKQMGAVYLKRLLCLHFNRTNALKQILLAPPHPHPPTKECDFTQQKVLTRAWGLVSAHLAWEARPDLSTSSMRKAFQPLTESLTCKLCQSGLEKRVKDIINQWAGEKITI
jgi:hypothetical protein